MRIEAARPALVFQAPPGARVQAPPSEEPVETYTPAAEAAAEAPEERAHSVSGLKRMGMGLMVGLSLAGMGVGLAGCSGPAPNTPSISTEISYYLMSAQDEAALGQQVAARLESEVPVWKDAAAQARLDAVAAKLTPHSSRSDVTYTFKLLDTDQVNAVAAPGGPIYVTRGLMEHFQDDGELTFVVGHEMGHIEQRHAVKSLGKARIMDWVARKVTGDKSQAAQVVARITEQLLDNQFSQADEFEADQEGLRHVVQAGLSPWKAVRGLEHLRALESEEQPEIQTKIFGSHPPTRERIEAVKEIALKTEPDPGR